MSNHGIVMTQLLTSPFHHKDVKLYLKVFIGYVSVMTFFFDVDSGT
jgi:hypothetical protein